MLTEKTFTSQDLHTLQANQLRLKKTARVFATAAIPAAFLLGLFGILQPSWGYWETTGMFLLFFLFLFGLITFRQHILFRRDITQQLKYAGTFTVIRKTRFRNECSILTDAPELYRLTAISPGTFNQFAAGDTLYAEVSKHSKFVFKMHVAGLPSNE